MPDADTVWLTPLAEMCALLERVGLVVRWQEDCSLSHRATADSLIDAFTADAAAIAEQIGRPALDDLMAAHRLWSEWLETGRVRKFAIVAGKLPIGRRPHPGRDQRRRSVSERAGGRIAEILGAESAVFMPRARWRSRSRCASGVIAEAAGPSVQRQGAMVGDATLRLVPEEVHSTGTLQARRTRNYGYALSGR